MTLHTLKIQMKYADAVLSGEKSFEVRKNDRGFKPGDEIVFIVVNDSGYQIATPPGTLSTGLPTGSTTCSTTSRPRPEIRGAGHIKGGRMITDEKRREAAAKEV